MASKLYEVAYRVGGTLNFCWRPVLGRFTLEEARVKQAELRRAGYPSVAHPVGCIETIGLPETFDAKSSIV